MANEIIVPQLGESIVDATVGRWLKREGDAVTAGEPLVELETDKVNIEVAAPASGTLEHIGRQPGATVGVGEVLGAVGQGAPVATRADAARADARDGNNGQRGGVAPAAPAAETAVPTRATHLAQRVADEHGLDIARVPGTGPGGRVTHDDVNAYLRQQRDGGTFELAASAAAASAAAASAPGAAAGAAITAAPVTQDAARREERVRLTRRRLTIASRLVEAQHTAAMLTTFNEVDMSAVMDLRSRRRDAFRERHGVNLGYMSFFTRAVIGGLKAVPRLNAEMQGDEIVLKHYFDIGIAVSTAEGLVVPVLRDADRMTFAAIERNIAALAEKARSGTLTLDDLRGGTFTLTNGGTFGSLLSTPILNGPQVGILGMHKIEERPIAVRGQVVIHPMMYVAVSYDHRIVDGAEAVTFLVRVKELLEDPETLLLEA